MPRADKCIKCLRLYCLESFANKDGNTVCIFLKVLPFFCSNKIPIKLIHIYFFKLLSNFLHQNICLYDVIYPALACVLII